MFTRKAFRRKSSGEAIRQIPRETILISTQRTFPFGDGPNDMGSSRHHLTRQIEGSLKRLKTDYIDVYHMHAFDALTPPEETLSTLDEAVRQGKLRYIAASNFSGWHLQKSLVGQCRIWMGKVCGPPSLLFLSGPRLRVGVDAAGAVGRHWRFGLESAWLGPPHREDSPRSASTGR